MLFIKLGNSNLSNPPHPQTIKRGVLSTLEGQTQVPVKQGKEWKFSFVPKQGTGTYEIMASTVVEVKEKDTSTLAKVFGVGSTTAIVKPGLKIYSPVDKFFYPLGYPIKVETSLDGEPEEWKKIQWFLNGQPWAPNPNEPKQKLVIEKPGEYKLKAIYKNPGNIELSQEVSFSVKPVQVSISPQRKVMTYFPSLIFPLQAKVEFPGKPPIENSESPLDLGNGVSTKVSKVDWQVITKPPDGVNTKLEKNQLSPNLEFVKECAVTALATVTATISKTFKTQKTDSPKTRIVEETYILPAIRADLWAVRAPIWGNINGQLLEDAFPKKAIAVSKRSFEVKSGNFLFEFETYNWLPTGPSKPVILKAALESNPPINANGHKIEFTRPGPENQTAVGSRFIPEFQNPAINTEIKLNTHLDFGASGRISFVENLKQKWRRTVSTAGGACPEKLPPFQQLCEF